MGGTSDTGGVEQLTRITRVLCPEMTSRFAPTGLFIDLQRSGAIPTMSLGMMRARKSPDVLDLRGRLRPRSVIVDEG